MKCREKKKQNERGPCDKNRGLPPLVLILMFFHNSKVLGLI